MAILLLGIVVIAGLVAIGTFILASRKKSSDRPTLEQVSKNLGDKTERLCPDCGISLPDNQRICHSCGYRFDRD